MKKHLLYGLLLSFVFSFMFISKIEALDMYVGDQSQLAFTGWASVYSEYKANQTFRVTKNVLTSVAIMMNDKKPGGTVTLTVKDENTGKTIVTKSQRMDDTNFFGFESFDLAENGVGYPVDVTHRFSMWVSTGFYEDHNPAWAFTNDSASYSRGFRRGNLLDLGGDHVFFTYGYDLVPEEPVVPAELPAEEEEVPPADTPIVVDEDVPPVDTPIVVDQEEDDGGDQDTPNSDSLTSEESEMTFEVSENDIDNSVKQPKIDSLLVNDEKEDYLNDVVVDSGDVMVLSGTAGAGDIVAIMIGDDTLTTFANTEGKWSVTAKTEGFVLGEYTVEAQSKNSDEKASSKVVLFDLTINEVEQEVATEKEEETEKNHIELIILSGIVVLLVVAIGVVTYKIIRNRKSNKDIKDDKIDNLNDSNSIETEVKK